jgi:hypothetical protein
LSPLRSNPALKPEPAAKICVIIGLFDASKEIILIAGAS